ncbi:type II toxin-antitoxin system prevent-host-death family antitoxin [Frankia sp. CNm7]|uniref:Antitoxin n=1 Tax=Frankia nepalensis TaxID=1836974 RepID=A0A937RBM5_9ACTN|nr:type II toxin-antitoxin system prevent-host-death family antitoxin [Frankia nepalensis]MBL7501863.1 type II toxin-antitoxin system prevent-host-death family antitoxin [Frankia nepalensis]MBL7513801.1 type II toxin-antitoxin system prevent-host-death family antitoxin [Frankia nepalensis]MBL7519984.1 type II toxin-antitoxin system prevent-host-death family antitoxin [Frankia nepalensis]MBL7629106.1 type II toxin-antitoxin system prevent-host-death family antitoxin [Frankia nepalensis]
MDVGIRELRDNLSRHLAAVRAGHTLTITDHGRAIARLVPVAEPTPLEQLIAEGVVEPAQSRTRRTPRPVAARGSVSGLVSEQRG